MVVQVTDIVWMQSFPDAMFYFASCYGEGQLGLQVDHERAFNLYQSAAKLNHAPSAYRTAGK